MIEYHYRYALSIFDWPMLAFGAELPYADVHMVSCNNGHKFLLECLLTFLQEFNGPGSQELWCQSCRVPMQSWKTSLCGGFDPDAGSLERLLAPH